MVKTRIAVIGVGYLGKEHARILASLDEAQLVAVVDTNPDQARLIGDRLGVQAYTNYDQILDHIDAATIVVPTGHHFQVAKDCLERGVDVLIEKPVTATLSEAEELARIATEARCVVQVGHIERFNPAFEDLALRPIRPKFIKAERLGPYTGRGTDVGVVLDLMIHDLDLVLSLTKAPLHRVEAVGAGVVGPHEDIANARLYFADGCVADLTASRISDCKVRKMHVWAAEGYARIDFARRELSLVQPTDPSWAEELRRSCFRSAATLSSDSLEMLRLDCSGTDQLTNELRHFVACVRDRTTPRVDLHSALLAMRAADAILASMSEHCWEGREDGPKGPQHLPAPIGKLFDASPPDQAAA